MTCASDEIFVPESGIVVSLDETKNLARGRVSRTEACRFCGRCAVGEKDGERILEAAIAPGLKVAVGEAVILEKNSKAQNRGLLFLLLLPIFSILLGAGIGFLLFPKSYGWQGLLVLAFLGASFLLAFLLARIFHWNKEPGVFLTARK